MGNTADLPKKHIAVRYDCNSYLMNSVDVPNMGKMAMKRQAYIQGAKDVLHMNTEVVLEDMPIGVELLLNTNSGNRIAMVKDAHGILYLRNIQNLDSIPISWVNSWRVLNPIT